MFSAAPFSGDRFLRKAGGPGTGNRMGILGMVFSSMGLKKMPGF
jgi:hypothetical protein